MGKVIDRQVFKMPRKGMLGNQPIGADYMLDIDKRAKRLSMAMALCPKDKGRCSHQLSLFDDVR